MTITPDTLREIEEKAKAATEGRWAQFDNAQPYGSEYAAVIWGPAGPGYGLIADCRSSGAANGPVERLANAAHIARMDPPTALALVARIRELEGALKPFAEAADDYDGMNDAGLPEYPCSVGDLRRAATAYKGE